MSYVVEVDEQRLDRVAEAIYGTETGGTVEALLAANPGLAALGLFLPRRTIVQVPARPVPPPNPAYLRVWGLR